MRSRFSSDAWDVGEAVQVFNMDSLDPADTVRPAKRTRKIASNVAFFKVGPCGNRKLVCTVKSGKVSSTIKALEPVEEAVRTPGSPKPWPSNQESLRVFKEVRFWDRGPGYCLGGLN
jgi:hypothetical protein